MHCAARPRQAFLLGFGTNHPKFEAARAKTDAARQRVEAASGAARIAVSSGPRGLGGARAPNAGAAAAAAAVAAGAKRKADDPKAKAASAAEAEALARREAARKRVEARTIGMFGLH